MFVSFWFEDSGATTVDFVVLTGGIAGLGLAVIATVSPAVNNGANGINSILNRVVSEAEFARALQSPLEYFEGDQTRSYVENAADTIRDVVFPDEFVLAADVRIDDLSQRSRTIFDVHFGGEGQFGEITDRIIMAVAYPGAPHLGVTFYSDYRNPDRPAPVSLRIPNVIVEGETANFGVTLDENNQMQVLKDGAIIGQLSLDDFSDERHALKVLTGTSWGGPSLAGEVSDVKIGAL